MTLKEFLTTAYHEDKVQVIICHEPTKQEWLTDTPTTAKEALTCPETKDHLKTEVYFFSSVLFEDTKAKTFYPIFRVYIKD